MFYREAQEKTKTPHFFIIGWFAVLCSLTSLLGCGYVLHSKASLPFRSVRIAGIENRTVEPKLEDRLQRALTEEFLRNGIAVNQGNGYILRCVLNRFELRVLSEKEGAAVEYEIILKGDFRITDTSGNTREFKDTGSPFIISISGSGPLENVIALKELGAEKAVRNMAMEIIGALVYR